MRVWLANGKQKHAGPSLTSPEFMPLVTGKIRGESEKFSPFGMCIPYINQQDGAHLSSVRNRNSHLFSDSKWTLEKLPQLSALPSALQPKHLSFFHGHHIYDFFWSLLLIMMFLLLLSSRESPLFQDQDLTWLRTSRREVSGSHSHPGVGSSVLPGGLLGFTFQSTSRLRPKKTSQRVVLLAAEKGILWSADSEPDWDL